MCLIAFFSIQFSSFSLFFSLLLDSKKEKCFSFGLHIFLLASLKLFLDVLFLCHMYVSCWTLVVLSLKFFLLDRVYLFDVMQGVSSTLYTGNNDAILYHNGTCTWLVVRAIFCLSFRYWSYVSYSFCVHKTMCPFITLFFVVSCWGAFLSFAPLFVQLCRQKFLCVLFFFSVRVLDMISFPPYLDMLSSFVGFIMVEFLSFFFFDWVKKFMRCSEL